MSEDLGLQREKELFAKLKEVFGPDCVYHSPVYKKSNGQEKELTDILIVALPYVISMQMKWLSCSSDDVKSYRGEVIEERIARRLEDAARQHKTLISYCNHNEYIGLPRVWDEGDAGNYDLPVELIEKVIPVVIVDFNDKDYQNPEKRLQLRPVVLNASSEVTKSSLVHSFLYRDFLTILHDIFTPGDLIGYLLERNKLVYREGRFNVGYDELFVFAAYLTKRPVVEEMQKYDNVFIAEPGIYEKRMAEIKDKLQKRRELYSRKDHVDWLLDSLKQYARNSILSGASISAVAAQYIVSQSRLKCFGSMFKRIVANKMTYCFQRVAISGDPSHMTYFTNNEEVINGQALIIGCIGTSDLNFVLCASTLQDWALSRFITATREKLRDRIKEVLMILFTPSRKKVLIWVRPLQDADFDLVLLADEARVQARNLKVDNYHYEEWRFVDEQARIE